MKRTVAVILLMLLACAASAGQTRRRGTPRRRAPRAAQPSAAATVPAPVRRILDDYVRALGGAEAIRKLHSRVAKGTVELTALGAKGTVEAYHEAPNKLVVMMHLPGLGTIQEGFDGSVGWSQDPFTGVREQSGAELVESRRDADFYRDLDLSKGYTRMELKGTEKVAGRDAHVVEAAPPGAGRKPDRMYFDAATKLLVRLDTVTNSPQGAIPVEAYIEEYRAVDGVKVPFAVRQAVAGSDIVIRFEEVTHNVSIDDAKFAKPAGR